MGQLLDALLINVTAFFRDRAAWKALAERLPSLVAADGDLPIRVWSAGCSSGEEAYTLAILLREILGSEAFAQRVKIYATDVDEGALEAARVATYGDDSVAEVPSELLERYFTHAGSRWTVVSEIRRSVVFGRHDLLHDAPIPRIDLLTCRNVLMYLEAPTRTRVLETLRFALRPSGLLFLGRAEMLVAHSRFFTPVDLKLRLFAPESISSDERRRPAVTFEPAASARVDASARSAPTTSASPRLATRTRRAGVGACCASDRPRGAGFD